MTANPEWRQQEKERKESGMAARAPESGTGPAWSSPSLESRTGQPHHAPLWPRVSGQGSLAERLLGRPCGGIQQRAGQSAALARRWAVVLAGGDGIRLRRLTRFICGDDRPKQFCPLVGALTLLQEARQRAERSVLPDQILCPVTRAHQTLL